MTKYDYILSQNGLYVDFDKIKVSGKLMFFCKENNPVALCETNLQLKVKNIINFKDDTNSIVYFKLIEKAKGGD